MPVATVRSQPKLLQPKGLGFAPLEKPKPKPIESQKRRVTFKQVVAVRPIKHVDNMTDEELDDIWYNRDDFDGFKMSFLRIVKLLSSGAYLGDDENNCARGLEGRTREGAFLRKANKYHGRQAVLCEQQRQRNLGINDENFISKAYIVENLRCRLTALERGIQDQNEVFEELTNMNDCSIDDTVSEVSDQDNDETTETTEELSSDEELSFYGEDDDDDEKTTVLPHERIIVTREEVIEDGPIEETEKKKKKKKAKTIEKKLKQIEISR